MLKQLRKVHAINKYLRQLTKTIDYLQKYSKLINNNMLSKTYVKIVKKFPTKEVKPVVLYTDIASFKTDLQHFTSEAENKWPGQLILTDNDGVQGLEYMDGFAVFDRPAKVSDVLLGMKSTRQYLTQVRNNITRTHEKSRQRHNKVLRDTHRREAIIQKMQLTK